jgi:hydroxypyruvate isomerase
MANQGHRPGTGAIAMSDFAARLEIGLSSQDLPRQIAAIAGRGHDAVEVNANIGVPPDALAAALRQHGLAAVVLDIATMDASLICDPARVDEFRVVLDAGLSWAQAIGCWSVNCPVGALPAGVLPEIALATVADNLRYASRAALASGRRILLEPLPVPPGLKPAVSCIVDAIALLDLGTARNLALTLNLAADFGRRDSLSAIVGRYLTRIGHIRIGKRLAAEVHEQIIRFADQRGYRGWIGCGDTAAAWLERFPPKNARGTLWGMPKEALRLIA